MASPIAPSPSDTTPPADPPTPKRVPIPPRGVDYRGKIVLAPMVRSGELPSRLAALHYGADLVWGPETVDRALIGTTRRINPRTGMIEFTRPSSHVHNAPVTPSGAPAESIIYRLDPTSESAPRRLIFQLGSASPSLAVAAARIVAPDVAGIDLNAGCPKPFSTHGGMGAVLLQTPDLLCSILEALVTSITPEFGIGISVKIRLLETAAETEALVRRLVATGITGLTVHCRTTPMRPRERAIRGQLAMVGRVCREAGVACVMNGDVASRGEAQKLMAEYGVDGAMIATAAEKNPSVFSAAGPVAWEEVAARYVRLAMGVENKMANTKFLLNQMIPGKSPLYKAVCAVKSYTGVVEVLGMGEEDARVAAEVDSVMGTTERVKRNAAEKEGKEKKRAREEKKDRWPEAKKARTMDVGTTWEGKTPPVQEPAAIPAVAVDEAVEGAPSAAAAVAV
ncbi:hypothetical protein QBC39DRAFT_368803 [Podospora conica]|nr:hypothetical protein QBC39DRAFT_368803 [Schizothecium conicum]